MKKMITSVGLVAFGAANLQAQQYAPAPELNSFQTTKPWSVSAALRGFYDDNYTTRPSGTGKRESFGFEVRPSVGLNWTLPQTYIGLNYDYGMRYYEDREQDSADHTHQADLKLNHTFTERYKLDASDSFLYSNEPELIDAVGTPLRVDDTYLRNIGKASLTAGLTDQLSTVVGYSNTYYNFDQEGIGSLSALLDRTEHLISANLRWQALPDTVGILGYQYGSVGYDDGNQILPGVTSDIRDNTSHYVLVGADHSFNPQLSGSVRVGAQFVEWTELARFSPASDDSKISPYADASVTWSYAEGTTVQVGVRHARQATDISLFNLSEPTQDQEATTVYGQVTRQLLPRLNGSLLAQFQSADFAFGGADGLTENFFLAGVNFSYEINKFLTGEAGYNFDRLDSDIALRSFSRNRVYLGIRANY